MTENQSLVSIGLPTYNRAPKLKRSIESVLAQDYPNIELVISDNASTDGTQALCEEICRRDNRVRYVRQSVNRGLTANYMEVLHNSRGAFFVWLSDDDWLDRSYVSRCLQVLQAQPAYALVGGKAKYWQDGEFFFEHEVNLLEDSGSERVLTYLRRVGRNGTFYGVMRRDQLVQLSLQNTLGGDWLLTASMAFMGKAEIIEDVHIHRTCAGNSADLTQLALSFGMSKFQAHTPWLSVARNVFKDIAWKSSAYRSINAFARLALAGRAFRVIYKRHFVPYSRIQFSGHRKRLLTNIVSLKRRITAGRAH